MLQKGTLSFSIICLRSPSPSRVLTIKTAKVNNPIFLYFFEIISKMLMAIHIKPKLPNEVKKIIIGLKKLILYIILYKVKYIYIYILNKMHLIAS